MSFARDLVYSFVENLARRAYKEGIPYNSRPIEPGSKNDDYLHGLLDQVEEERLHDEAQQLYDMHDEVLLTHGAQVAQGFAKAAIRIDPYRAEGEQLFHKVTGELVVGLKPGERRHVER